MPPAGLPAPCFFRVYRGKTLPLTEMLVGPSDTKICLWAEGDKTGLPVLGENDYDHTNIKMYLA
jgi:hypothetical protein